MEQQNNRSLALKNNPLIFRIGKNSLMFATQEQQLNDVPIFETYTVRSGISMAANLREAFKESALLSHHFTRSKVLIDTPVILIPSEEFFEKDAEMLYRCVYNGALTSEILYYNVEELNCVALFEVNKDLKLVLNDNISNVEIIPSIYPLWRFVHRNFYSFRHQRLFVSFNDKTIDVFCFNKNRFKFANSFSFAHTNDVVYYVMHVWKLLGLNVDSDRIMLLGDSADNEQYINALKKYVKNVDVIDIEDKLLERDIVNTKNVPFDLITYFLK